MGEEGVKSTARKTPLRDSSECFQAETEEFFGLKMILKALAVWKRGFSILYGLCSTLSSNQEREREREPNIT